MTFWSLTSVNHGKYLWHYYFFDACKVLFVSEPIFWHHNYKSDIIFANIMQTQGTTKVILQKFTLVYKFYIFSVGNDLLLIFRTAVIIFVGLWFYKSKIERMPIFVLFQKSILHIFPFSNKVFLKEDTTQHCL